MEADEAKLAIDTAIGTGAITMPMWISVLEGWLGFGILVGGFVLVILRIALAIRDWNRA
jgi:hypothetical protein